MFVRFVVPRIDPSGGFFLATCRLAAALTEIGHRCELTLPATVARTEAIDSTTLCLRTVDALPDTADYPVADALALQRELSAGSPDLLVVAYKSCDVLDAAREVAPAVLHAHLSWPACPDATRYWHRVGRACSVGAGLKCLALRPVLGCSSRASVVKPQPVLRWRRLADLLATGTVGVISISGPQVALMRRHGVPEQALVVIPNLGMRMRVEEISDAAETTPVDDRSAVAYFGRLSKDKGAALLPALAAAAPPPGLRAFGDGYLRERLGRTLEGSLRGHVSQSRVAGVMSWARAVAFPSRWPEPGGIVGLDAQLFGVPLAGFAVGAALDWPAANLFAPGDSRAMADWLASQPTVSRPRDPDAIAARQAAYWERVGRRASVALESFATAGRFPPLDLAAVSEDLGGALSS